MEIIYKMYSNSNEEIGEYNTVTEYNNKDKNKGVYIFSMYKLCPKNKDLNFCYVGRTANYKLQKYHHKSSIDNINIKTPLVLCIRNSGGWNEWEMTEIEKFKCNSRLEGRIRQQTLIKQYNANLNIRNPIKDTMPKIKDKLKDKIEMNVKKNKDISKERKDKFIEKNKEKRHEIMNKNRQRNVEPIVENIVEQTVEQTVEQNEDETIYCFSNDSMPGIYKIGRTKREMQVRLKEANASNTWKPPTPYKVVFAKKVKNMEKETLLHKILSKYRVNPNREFFKVCIDEVKDLFDLMDGEYQDVTLM